MSIAHLFSVDRLLLYILVLYILLGLSTSQYYGRPGSTHWSRGRQIGCATGYGTPRPSRRVIHRTGTLFATVSGTRVSGFLGQSDGRSPVRSWYSTTIQIFVIIKIIDLRIVYFFQLYFIHLRCSFLF